MVAKTICFAVQVILSIVLRYSDASLLKSIRGLSILYDYYVTESDKIISSSSPIDSILLPYCTRVFLQKCHFKTFIHYRKHFIDRQLHNNTSNIDVLILNLQ